MKKNNLTTGYSAAIIRPCFPGETPKDGMAALIKKASPQMAGVACRVFPSATGLMIVCTLILHFTIGPGLATLPSDGSADQDNLAAAGNLALANMESLGSDYNLINRGSNDSLLTDLSDGTAAGPTTGESSEAAVTEPTEPAQTTVAATETSAAETTPETTVVETTLSPYDANGIERELLSVDQFTGSNRPLFLQVNSANMRQQPTTETDVVGKLVYGEACTQVSYGSSWSRITSANGTEGYILTRFLGESPPPTPTPVPTAAPTPVPVQTTAATQAPAQTTAVPVSTSTGSALTAEQQQTMINLARSCLGVTYVYGSEDMSGFDCSGFTTYIYQQMFGLTLPRSAKTQAGAGIAVGAANIQIGDILCFDWSSSDGVCDHVGLYIGNGQYIHASSSKGLVLESTVNFSRNPIVSIRRIIQ